MATELPPPDHAARIAEIRRQLEAATPGPFTARPNYYSSGMYVENSDGVIVAEVYERLAGLTRAQAEAFAQMVAAAPENIRYLLDRVAELEHQLGEPTEPTDIVTAFEELAAASGDTWDGVDAQQYVRDLRETDRTTNGADAMTMLTPEELARRDGERTEAERGWALLQGLGMDAAVVRLLDGWSARDSTAQWHDAPTLLAALEAAAGEGK